MVQVTSQTDGHLTLESEGSDVTLRGNEGLEIDGMEVELIAEDDLELTTVSTFGFYRQQIGVARYAIKFLFPVADPGFPRREVLASYLA